MRNVNKAFAEVTGKEVNKEAGYGQEVQCTCTMRYPVMDLRDT